MHRSRPQMPSSYGIDDGPPPLEWVTVEKLLVEARNYRVVSVRPDGRPHATPVWGLWRKGCFWLSTDPDSRKGRNLLRSGEIVVHLESGDEVAIVEGTAVVFRVRPRRAFGWRERDFPTSATRWET
ncbi:MAG: pyridoxamine 5'-phosphate oxidase family protein [Candidatus Eremiobacterota bacterium]